MEDKSSNSHRKSLVPSDYDDGVGQVMQVDGSVIESVNKDGEYKRSFSARQIHVSAQAYSENKKREKLKKKSKYQWLTIPR